MIDIKPGTIEGFTNSGSRFFPPLSFLYAPKAKEVFAAPVFADWAPPCVDDVRYTDPSFVSSELDGVSLKFKDEMPAEMSRSPLLDAKTVSETLAIGNELFGEEIDAYLRSQKETQTLDADNSENTINSVALMTIKRTTFYEEFVASLKIDKKTDQNNPFVFVPVKTAAYEYPSEIAERRSVVARLRKIGGGIVSKLDDVAHSLKPHARHQKNFEDRLTPNQKHTLTVGALGAVLCVVAGIALAAPRGGSSNDFRIPAIESPAPTPSLPGRIPSDLGVNGEASSEGRAKVNVFDGQLPLVYKGDAGMDKVNVFQFPPVVPPQNLAPKVNDSAIIGEPMTEVRMPLGLLSDFHVKDPVHALNVVLDAYRVLYKGDYELRDGKVWLKGTNTMMDMDAARKSDSIIQAFYGPSGSQNIAIV